MRVLITGINGRVGKCLAKVLIEKKYEVIGLDITDSIDENLNVYSYVKADITDINSLDKALKEYKVDYVIHLAALAHFSSNNIGLEYFMKVNCEAALNVAKIAYKCGAKKFLFSSTVEVYGHTNTLSINESTQCNPITNYGKSKYEAENILSKYLNTVGIEYYIFRFTPVYLKEYKKDLEKRIILPKNLGAFYFKDGSQKFSLCSINNVIDSIIAFLERKIEPGVYIISDKEIFTAKEIIDMKKSIGEVKRVIHMPYKLVYISVTLCSSILEKFNKAEKGLLINNLNKLVNPIYFDSSKIASSVELKWNIKNTLL